MVHPTVKQKMKNILKKLSNLVFPLALHPLCPLFLSQIYTLSSDLSSVSKSCMANDLVKNPTWISNTPQPGMSKI